MFKNFFRSSMRSIRKNRVYSFISIFGLAVAFSSAFLIVQYIDFEKSYDNYHEAADRIYRIETNLVREGGENRIAGSYMGFGLESADEIPEISSAFSTFVNLAEYSLLSHEINGSLESVNIERLHFVTQSIFDVFTFEVIEGSLEDALVGPSQVVITRSLAEKLYGPDFSAVGKRINVTNDVLMPFTISAVVEDLPENSHFKMELLTPVDKFKSLYPDIYEEGMWSFLNHQNYVKLEPEADPVLVEQKLNALLAQKRQVATGEILPKMSLRAVRDIHLHSNLSDEHEAGGDARAVQILGLIAIVIVIIAYANYVNLTTSVNLRRAKEVGVRKVIGSSQGQLVVQFLMESVIITFFSAALAGLFVSIGSAYLTEVLDYFPKLYLLQSRSFLGLVITGLLFLSVLVGLYPALVVSGRSTVNTLKGKFIKSARGSFVYKALVTAQFSVATILILFTLVVNTSAKIYAE